MELAWQWRGYGISIRVLRREAENRAAEPAKEPMVQSHSAQERREEADRGQLLASGSRYIGPIR
jgi:hypothetical protein